MAAVWLLCFDYVYLVAGVTSYMLARSSVRHLLRSYAPHVQICWSTKLSKYTYNETTSAGNSDSVFFDKRGQRILRHVVSAVVVVGDTPSDASVAHHRLINNLAHIELSSSSKTRAILSRHGSIQPIAISCHVNVYAYTCNTHACTMCFYLSSTIVGTSPRIYIGHFAAVAGVRFKLKRTNVAHHHTRQRSMARH